MYTLMGNHVIFNTCICCVMFHNIYFTRLNIFISSNICHFVKTFKIVSSSFVKCSVLSGCSSYDVCSLRHKSFT